MNKKLPESQQIDWKTETALPLTRFNLVFKSTKEYTTRHHYRPRIRANKGTNSARERKSLLGGCGISYNFGERTRQILGDSDIYRGCLCTADVADYIPPGRL